ncbi:hypothetical protein [Bacillus haynesii]|uniref:hypothetical protein n=1 Tax=Bacillus haynesii TaxID=1925021 RepID=UPI00228157DE|nr:hypothetical protein [Bacillus haynesii]MCY7861591.1 hypothetical protein [Bacillus haynesii]MCY9153919.1 hypothetical protein [Bacillus haynesii]
MEKSAIERLMDGYNKTEKEHIEKGTQNEAEKQGDVTDFGGEKQERELTSVEKIAQAYKPKEG